MIVGVGVDVVNIPRFAATLERTPQLAERLFADEERGLPIESLAARFAAKEAVAKSLGAPPGLAWRDAWVSRGEHGKPSLHVAGTVAAAAKALGATSFQVSLSHDDPVAMAMVVAVAM